MAKVQILFVYKNPNDPQPAELFGEVIDAVEGPGENPVHVGVFALGGFVEALFQTGVTLTQNVEQDAAGNWICHNYDGVKTEVFIVNVPDLEAALDEWRSLIGLPYSIVSCAAGGLHDAFGLHWSPEHKTGYNCSETVALGLRKGRLQVLPGTPACCITPEDLRAGLVPFRLQSIQ